MTDYIDRLDPSKQIDMIDAIASLLFNYNYAQDFRPNEEECTQLGRQILALVLDKFRPDLTEPPAEFEYRQTIIDTYPETDVQIPCLIRSSTSGIALQVEGYEQNMSAYLEYYEGRLQIHVWGEKSLRNGGDPDATVLITNNYERFRRDIDEFYAESEC